MKFWGTLTTGGVFVAATFFACVESASETRIAGDGDFRSVSAGDAGLGGTGGGGPDAATGGMLWTAGAGPVLEPCAPILADASSPTRGELGLDFNERLTREGHVTGVAADRIEVTTPEQTYSFYWQGPALDTVFYIDDAVQIVGTFSTGYGLATPRISTLRSSRATAVVVAGNPYTGLRVEPGSTTKLRGLAPELPELVYGLVSCCSHQSVFVRGYSCDYSALEAKLDGSSTAILPGATGTIGPWSVTNLESSYTSSYELTWGIRVTLLGPATPRSVDGGI